MTAKCTCRIVESYRHAFPRDTARGVPVIQHCPLCASATELLEACKATLIDLRVARLLSEKGFGATIARLEAAIAHAEAPMNDKGEPK